MGNIGMVKFIKYEKQLSIRTVPSTFFYRWRLQKAFYYEDVDSSGKGSVKEEQCCYCYDIFPGGHCPKCCCPSCRCPPTDLDQPEDGKTDTKKRKIKKALTLADLADIKPHYISSVVVNGWRREYERKYCLLTMSPEGWWNLHCTSYPWGKRISAMRLVSKTIRHEMGLSLAQKEVRSSYQPIITFCPLLKFDGKNKQCFLCRYFCDRQTTNINSSANRRQTAETERY